MATRSRTANSEERGVDDEAEDGGINAAQVIIADLSTAVSHTNPGVFGPWGDLHRGVRWLQRPARVNGDVWRYAVKA